MEIGWSKLRIGFCDDGDEFSVFIKKTNDSQYFSCLLVVLYEWVLGF
jgi:hypothetical protein